MIGAEPPLSKPLSSNPSSPIETEVKIRMGEGAAAARHMIESHGFQMTEDRTLQVDQVFDFSDFALRQSGRLLRVRSENAGDSGILTYKGPAAQGGLHKSREELETTLGNRAMLELTLDRLGFVPTFRYEKYRTTFRSVLRSSADQEAADERGLIALDETPIGVFLELEGPAYWIDRTAVRLGFSPEEYITFSYARLYRDYLSEHPGPSDMLFLGDVVRSSEKDS